jgi:neutral ceramidase
MGTILAAEVLRGLPRLAPAGDGPVRGRREIVPLPLPPVDDAMLERAKAVAARVKEGSKPGPKFMEQVEAFKALDVAAREGKPVEAEVQVIALGSDVAWVGLPGEIFVELGLALKRDSPFRHTLVVELANGSVGYVPTQRAYAEGNYEVVSARVGEGSGEMLVEAARRMLKALAAK